MAGENTIVHITHEAVGKVGGIGAVLNGLFTCKSYLDTINRSIIIGPLFSTEGSVLDRLGEDGEVLYSSIDGLVNTGYMSAFRNIENFYNVGIVYGKRRFIEKETGTESWPEVLLFDIRHMEKNAINEFKKQLFEEFGIQSHLYENLWEYEQYIRIAPVAIASLKAIGAANDTTTVIAHEFMGLPTALAAILERGCRFRTIFYAHEVATMRRIVEHHHGHDTMFYNVIKKTHDNRLYVTDIFGDQSSYFKHSLVKASRHCDSIWAVGDYVVKELRFLAPEFETADIDIVYNGIPAYKISSTEKQQSREKLCQYCRNLLGYRPDFIFTHVTRLVKSKGLWRDLRVLEHMDREFRIQGKTGVLLILSTEVSRRRSRDIYDMESKYHWPLAHREGWPDLSGGEADFYTAIQEFNAKSHNIKVIFINQFGFNKKYCGNMMPDDIEFMDVRKGSDVEFGQSIYEPFGIAQLEPLTFGGICVVSSVCGCVGFIEDVTGRQGVQNVIVADYTNLESKSYADIEDILSIERSVRDEIEQKISENVAMQICSRLPKNENEINSLIESGYAVAGKMTWDVMVQKYFLKSLQKNTKKKQKVDTSRAA
jgi:glycosyltransferase involved in cell wall biosynthesis